MRYLIRLLCIVLFFSCGSSKTDPDFDAVSRSLSGEKTALRGLLERAFAAYDRKDAGRAKDLLGQLEARGVMHPIVIYRLAVVSAATGEGRRAGDLFKRAAALFTARKMGGHRYAAWSLMGLGNLHYRKKEYDEALKWYLKAAGIRPDDGKILTRIGRLYFLKRDYTLALHHLQRVRGHVPGRILLGEAYLRLKRYRAAHGVLAPLFRKGVSDRNGSHTRLAINYGLSLIGLAQKQAERKEYRLAYFNAHKARALFLQISLRFKDADADPFLRRLKPSRRQYFITRSREYLVLCRQMVRKYEKYLHMK